MSDVAYCPADAPAPKPARPGAPKLAEPGKTCRLKLSFSIFFDGTNNNRQADIERGDHSNVVRLFDACKEDQPSGINRIYIPGVGTPFPLIGEHEPHRNGSSMGSMGAERIRYAMLEVANTISVVVARKLIVPRTGIPAAIADKNNPPRWRRQLTQMIAAAKGRISTRSCSMCLAFPVVRLQRARS